MRIVINEGEREVRGRPGRSLLASLMAEGVHLPSGCGGQGLCGLCRVQVEEGAGALTEAELRLIPEEERRQGLRLSCQIPVACDLRIRLPEALDRIRAFAAETRSVRQLTREIRMIEMRLVGRDSITFEAGAYMQLVLPLHSDRGEPLFRAYSIASPPSARGGLELIIRRVDGGVCSSWIFEHLEPGTRCTLIGPFGDLYLRDTRRELLFVASGSGMAPIRSILLDMTERQVRRPATFLFGARTRDGLFLTDEMRALEARLAGFRFIPVLSNPLPEDRWRGETGRLTEAIARLPRSLEGFDAYLSGSPGVVDACLRALRSRGLPDGHAFFDRFA